ncbi:tyrosine-type recombinase/integrase [Providencia alcalifaciens]|uniref:tyrosine-type recombinase/integrase n=1 Tax=Providencia alcalifaciens TaxID=126385 RepID=UPI00055F6D22|nr:tyrosine-type recombinase/integrase [Providencia alcalifaciens]
MRKYLTNQEWKFFFEAITGDLYEARDKAIFRMVYEHGLRVSELTGIKISDIDLYGKTVYIKRLKNGFSTTHPIQKHTYQLIINWLKERKKYTNSDNEPWLFISRQGGKISRQWIYHLCKKYSKKAQLSIDVHPHMLRHACGFALANQGLDTRLIQDYLGHRNILHTVYYTASNFQRFQKVWK